MSTAYDQARFEDNYPSGMGYFYWTRARNRILANALRRHALPMPMVEVGCGTGIVTGHLRKAGFAVTGIEIGTPVVEEAARPFVLTGQDAFTVDPELCASFKSIGLFDVIEHIEDAPAFIRALLQAYPNVQRVFISVPAGPELWSDYDVHFGHFRRYTEATLRGHLRESGLEPVMVRNLFPSLYCAQRLALAIGTGRKRRVDFDPPVEQPRRAMHAALAGMLLAEHALLPGWIKGSSLLALGARTR